MPTLRPEDLRPPAAGAVRQLTHSPWFELVTPAGVPDATFHDWLTVLDASDVSRQTLRAYSMSGLRYFRYCWAIGLDWRRSTELDITNFVLWARSTEKYYGNRNPPAPRPQINRTTGKKNLSTGYSAATINHTLATLQNLFAYLMTTDAGPLRNPIPTTTSARHHNPEDPYLPHRRGRLRQKEQKTLPRAIPDDQFDALFRRMNNNRDRALLSIYVSSGARANEILTMRAGSFDLGENLIYVHRKGGDYQWIPISGEATTWLNLYLVQRGVPRHGEPVWLTLREPYTPLNYDAFRAVIRRANDILGTNWTLHDLRHTFALRALNGGVQLYELQHLLGHRSLETTGIYARPRTEDLIASYRRMNARIESMEEPSSEIYDQSELDRLFGNS